MLEVQCPCCNEMLTIDVKSGKVISHTHNKKNNEMDLGRFIDDEKNRKETLEGLFEQSKKDDKKRKKQLDDEFFKAKQDPDSLKGEYQNPFDWE